MSRADDPVTECLGKIIDFVLGIIFCIVFFVIVVSTLTTAAIVFGSSPCWRRSQRPAVLHP